ncbi:MAG: response regulator [Proteobacteria bacterium]|uniref:response regulator n=1 Tax=Aquabacterium sp. TaxID=1872578 RepID=UPI0035C6F97D|nr:response regulator [Pseudomonadota bacterium]
MAEAVAAPAAGGPRGLLLYIEDNPVNAILVQQLLAGWPDVEVVVAPTGGEGLVQARQLRPDLVLLDMNLPDMGGVDVLRKLRSEDATRGLRVIALSAATLQDDIDAAKAAGADAYWTKPIDFVQVLQGVEAALSGRIPGAQTQGQATPSVLMKAV